MKNDFASFLKRRVFPYKLRNSVIWLETAISIDFIGISLLTFLVFQNLRENLSGNVKKDLR